MYFLNASNATKNDTDSCFKGDSVELLDQHFCWLPDQSMSEVCQDDRSLNEGHTMSDDMPRATNLPSSACAMLLLRANWHVVVSEVCLAKLNIETLSGFADSAPTRGVQGPYRASGE